MSHLLAFILGRQPGRHTERRGRWVNLDVETLEAWPECPKDAHDLEQVWAYVHAQVTS